MPSSNDRCNLSSVWYLVTVPHSLNPPQTDRFPTFMFVPVTFSCQMPWVVNVAAAAVAPLFHHMQLAWLSAHSMNIELPAL